MEIRTEVRAIEAHLAAMATSKSKAIEIISKAQSMAIASEHHLMVLAIVKNRIIHAK